MDASSSLVKQLHGQKVAVYEEMDEKAVNCVLCAVKQRMALSLLQVCLTPRLSGTEGALLGDRESQRCCAPPMPVLLPCRDYHGCCGTIGALRIYDTAVQIC
jgi:hypothetical protein